MGAFDGDRKADILWRNSSTGENYLYPMNGLTIASEGFLRTVADLAWQVKGIGDFNGDHKADILWRNSSTGENYLYVMNGLSIASEGYLRTVADQAWQVKGIGDFDGDGKADILWRNSVTGEDYAYFMNGSAIASEGFLNTVSDPYWMPRSATTLADVTGWDTIAPSTPAGLTASAVSSSRINLSWLAATDNVGVIRYGVYRNGVQIDIVAGTSYANTGLAAATPYSYTALANDTSWNASALSAPLSATTPGTGGTVPTPYTGTPIAVPGSFEAENFDLGGEGVAYHDKTPGNQGGNYRLTEDVDIVMSYDALGGGYVVNNFETGEWLAYTINVAASAQYNIEIRASSALANSAFHVEIDGQDVTGQ